MAAGFDQRLTALGSALEAHLATKQEVVTYPNQWRKILWLRLAGDAFPDALVILRPSQNECAAAAHTSQPCRAVLLTGLPSGTFRVVTEFGLLVHPLAFLLNAQGLATDLLYSRDTQAVPSYSRYRWSGQEFQRVDGTLDSNRMRQLPSLVADDRSMSLLESQRYAARSFNNSNASLAPFRLHYDNVAITERLQGVFLSDLGIRETSEVKDINQLGDRSVDSLLPMMQAMSETFSWSQTLDVRLWSCVDWMVQRRFWEIEGYRLGRPGACIEPAIIGLLIKEGEASVDLKVAMVLKQQLSQQLGMALLLRALPLSAVDREALRRGGAGSSYMAAVAGLYMGHVTRTHSIEQAADAIQLLRSAAELWFDQVEMKRKFFVTPTSELRAFFEDVGLMAEANQCLRVILKMPASQRLKRDDCGKERLENARAIVKLIQELHRS